MTDERQQMHVSCAGYEVCTTLLAVGYQVLYQGLKMGQDSVKMVKDTAPVQLAAIQGKLQSHAVELRQIASLTYTQFLDSFTQLNSLTQTFSDSSGKQLLFEICDDSDRSLLWKGTVRIKCHKVNTNTGETESSRILNLKQYIHLYNEITLQASQGMPSTHDRRRDISASILLEGVDSIDSKSGSDENECCVCMDRKALVELTCEHRYCEQCFDQWHLSHRTCPICRAKVDGCDDAWVLTEKPDEAEMQSEKTEYLMSLADSSGKPQ